MTYALSDRYWTQSGYFDDFDAFAEHAARLSGHGAGVYSTLNPVTPALLARARNRVERYARTTTADADIRCRRWLLLDFDPVRPTGISSTDPEHAAARAAARECRDWLVATLGIPATALVLADSGNGAHVLARIDLPNTAEATALVRHCLKAVALRCNTPEVLVDPTVYNAARIVKVYGTVAAKGDSTTDRPHRCARVRD